MGSSTWLEDALWGVTPPRRSWIQAWRVSIREMCHDRRNADIISWWINSMFAYHAGIIDSGIPTGRIISGRDGAYAILLNEYDELDCTDASRFTYKAKNGEVGRYKLSAATTASRQPVRVLRYHGLHSFFAPQAGIRYDGLYRVTGWSIKNDVRTKDWTYSIQFERLNGQVPMKEVLLHPLAEEIDDYLEHKRIRRIAMWSQNKLYRTRPLPVSFDQQGKDMSHTAHRPIDGRAAAAPAPMTPVLVVPTITLNRPVPSRARKSNLRIELPDPSMPLPTPESAAEPTRSRKSGLSDPPSLSPGPAYRHQSHIPIAKPRIESPAIIPRVTRSDVSALVITDISVKDRDDDDPSSSSQKTGEAAVHDDNSTEAHPTSARNAPLVKSAGIAQRRAARGDFRLQLPGPEQSPHPVATLRRPKPGLRIELPRTPSPRTLLGDDTSIGAKVGNAGHNDDRSSGRD